VLSNDNEIWRKYEIKLCKKAFNDGPHAQTICILLKLSQSNKSSRTSKGKTVGKSASSPLKKKCCKSVTAKQTG